MNIVVFARHFPSISQTFVTQEVTTFAQGGIEVSVLASSPDWPSGKNLPLGLNVNQIRTTYYNLPTRIGKRICSGLRILMRSLGSRKLGVIRTLNVFKFGLNAIDLSLLHVYFALRTEPTINVLHCHFGPIGVLGAHLKRLGLIERLIVTFHGYDISKAILKKSTRRQYSALFEEADLLLPVSEAGVEVLRSLGAPDPKIKLHRMGVNIPEIDNSAVRKRSDPIRILTVARLTEKKGLYYAIEALSRISRSGFVGPLRYDIVGGGEQLDELSGQILRLGLENIVQLHGSKNSDEVMTFMKQSDIFILPSVTSSTGDKEGIPVSLMEAMAHGLPVVSTWHSGIPELVEDSVSGFLVPERDIHALTEAILRLLMDGATRKALGDAARRKVAKDYNAERQMRILQEYFALDSKPSAASQ
jgi:colanic acid/amylovoran biosynthesis glycosyltransferase